MCVCACACVCTRGSICACAHRCTASRSSVFCSPPDLRTVLDSAWPRTATLPPAAANWIAHRKLVRIESKSRLALIAAFGASWRSSRLALPGEAVAGIRSSLRCPTRGRWEEETLGEKHEPKRPEQNITLSTAAQEHGRNITLSTAERRPVIKKIAVATKRPGQRCDRREPQASCCWQQRRTDSVRWTPTRHCTCRVPPVSPAPLPCVL